MEDILTVYMRLSSMFQIDFFYWKKAVKIKVSIAMHKTVSSNLLHV